MLENCLFFTKNCSFFHQQVLPAARFALKFFLMKRLFLSVVFVCFCSVSFAQKQDSTFSNPGKNSFAAELALGFTKDRFGNPQFMGWAGGRFDFYIKHRLSFSIGLNLPGREEATRNQENKFAMAVPMFLQIESTNRRSSGFIFGLGGIAQSGFGQPFFQPSLNARFRLVFREKRAFFEFQGLPFWTNEYETSYGHGGGVAFTVKRNVPKQMFGVCVGTYFK